jgi:hypothetical protein
MFSIKLLYDNRERCEPSPGVMHHALEAQKVRHAIRTMVEESALLDYSVGLSGSTALSWKIHEDPGKHPLSMIYFEPHDCDMFVCSKHCLDERGKSCFYRFVHSCIDRLKQEGYKVENLVMWEHRYIHAYKNTKMADVWVEGIASKLSFIECSEDDTVFQVVKQFDFDLVQAVYDFKNEKVLMEVEAERSLNKGYMHVSKRTREFIVFIEDGLESGELFPLSCQVWKLKSTYNRIQKYQLRGFHVVHGKRWRLRLSEIITETEGEEGDY